MAVRISLVRLVPQNFVWKESMKRQKALNRISRYHDAIGNSMNNNVFIYVLQEKDKFLRTAEISLKRRFSLLSVSRKPSSSDYLEEAQVPIKRLGSSQRNRIDRETTLTHQSRFTYTNWRFYCGTELNVSIRFLSFYDHCASNWSIKKKYQEEVGILAWSALTFNRNYTFYFYH